MNKTCEKCGKPIEGKHVEAFGKYYHPKHFRCVICDEVIENKFIEIDGEPCHEKCYKEYFAPRCGWCGEKIEDEGIKTEDETYHIDCYKENLGTNCDICGETIAGKYLTDFWGNNFCKKHHDEYPQCPYCSTLIAPGLGKEKVSYDDGRIVCESCDQKAVKSHSRGIDLAERVVKVLSSYGIEIDLDEIEINFVSKDKLEELAKSGSRGFTNVRKAQGGLGGTEIEVSLLENLPSFEFKRVIAHELMHVWLSNNVSGKVIENNEKFVEGSCEYASYLVIKNEDSKYGELQAELLHLNREETYKYGFEEVKNFVDEKGIGAWLEKLESF